MTNKKTTFFAAAAFIASLAGNAFAYGGHHQVTSVSDILLAEQSNVGVKADAGVTQDVAQVRTPTTRDNRFIDDEKK